MRLLLRYVLQNLSNLSNFPTLQQIINYQINQIWLQSSILPILIKSQPAHEISNRYKSSTDISDQNYMPNWEWEAQKMGEEGGCYIVSIHLYWLKFCTIMCLLIHISIQSPWKLHCQSPTQPKLILGVGWSKKISSTKNQA